MKKMKLLLVLFVVAMLALCACSKEQETNQDDGIEEVPVTESITQIDDAVSVQYTDNTTTITLVNENGIWYFEGDMETWLNQAEAYEIVEAASNLTSKDVVKDAGALADYGLETPVYTVIVKDAEGNAVTIYIGNSESDGTYYATIGEKDTVYIISEQLAGTLQFDKELLKEIIEEEVEDEMFYEEDTSETIEEDASETIEDDTSEVIEDIPEEGVEEDISEPEA